MSLANRIKQLREAQGLTQNELAKKVGITQQSYGKIEDGTTQRPRKILELAKALQCNPSWLLNGTGNPKIPSISSNIENAPGIKGNYPLINWVQAGDWSSIIEIPREDYIYYPCPVACSDRTFVLRVKGVSMSPIFNDGELIFVDPEKEAFNGKYIIARLDDQNEATFKQLIIEDGQKFLKPANPEWPNQLIHINGNCTIVGVVVFAGRIF